VTGAWPSRFRIAVHLEVEVGNLFLRLNGIGLEVRILRLDLDGPRLTPQCISKFGQLPDSAYTESELISNPGGARERYFVLSVAPKLVSVPAYAHRRFGRYTAKWNAFSMRCQPPGRDFHNRRRRIWKNSRRWLRIILGLLPS
jgi:hypothetical protein